jgi:hypothetical protein
MLGQVQIKRKETDQDTLQKGNYIFFCCEKSQCFCKIHRIKERKKEKKKERKKERKKEMKERKAAKIAC